MKNNSKKNNSSVRLATQTDSARICQVLIRSVREVCATDYGNNADILDSWCANKTPAAISDWIQHPASFFVVAELEPYGIIGTALYDRAKASVLMCYLVPEALHRGVGTKLLSSLESEAKRLGHREITLTSSITAHEFYKRNGYEDNGEPQYVGKVQGFPMRKLTVV